MKTTKTPCAWFFGQDGPRLPMSQHIHHCTALFFKRGTKCVFLFHPPSFHVLTKCSLCVVCVVGLWPPSLTYTTSVCVFLLSGFITASMMAPLTTSLYFLIFNSAPKMRFQSVGAENHNRLHCTTRGTSILKSITMLKISSSCWIVVLDVTHS